MRNSTKKMLLPYPIFLLTFIKTPHGKRKVEYSSLWATQKTVGKYAACHNEFTHYWQVWQNIHCGPWIHRNSRSVSWAPGLDKCWLVDGVLVSAVICLNRLGVFIFLPLWLMMQVLYWPNTTKSITAHSCAANSSTSGSEEWHRRVTS